MSLFNVFDIAGSAMSSESVRLNVTASNLANAQSVGIVCLTEFLDGPREGSIGKVYIVTATAR